MDELKRLAEKIEAWCVQLEADITEFRKKGNDGFQKHQGLADDREIALNCFKRVLSEIRKIEVKK